MSDNQGDTDQGDTAPENQGDTRRVGRAVVMDLRVLVVLREGETLEDGASHVSNSLPDIPDLVDWTFFSTKEVVTRHDPIDDSDPALDDVYETVRTL